MCGAAAAEQLPKFFEPDVECLIAEDHQICNSLMSEETDEWRCICLCGCVVCLLYVQTWRCSMGRYSVCPGVRPRCGKLFVSEFLTVCTCMRVRL